MKPSRSLQPLEAELKFVHEVSFSPSGVRTELTRKQKVNERDEDLRDRETYIKQLEDKLEIKHSLPSHKSSAQSLLLPQSIPLPASPITSTFLTGPTQTQTQTPALHVTMNGATTSLESVMEAPSPTSPTPAGEDEDRIRALKDSLSKLEDGRKTETQVRVVDLLR